MLIDGADSVVQYKIKNVNDFVYQLSTYKIVSWACYNSLKVAFIGESPPNILKRSCSQRLKLVQHQNYHSSSVCKCNFLIIATGILFGGDIYYFESGLFYSEIFYIFYCEK